MERQASLKLLKERRAFMSASHNQRVREFEAHEIRYAQCWEDADVMLAALGIKPGDICLSIASGGENTLSMLVANPRKVVAIDMNPSQLACLELKMAGFRCLTHCELLLLIGSVSSTQQYHQLFVQPAVSVAAATEAHLAKPQPTALSSSASLKLEADSRIQPSTADNTLRWPGSAKKAEKSAPDSADMLRKVQQQRIALYRRCRKYLSHASRDFWDARPDLIRQGIGAAGRFENYFKVFRKVVMPLIHSRRTVDELLTSKSLADQEEFYKRRWNTAAWQLLFRVFFSRSVMGALGRSSYQFQHVHDPVAERILSRTAYALQRVPTSRNAYLKWILTGEHGASLPHALRRENFEKIKRNIDRIELRCCSVENALDSHGEGAFDRFNLSDIFEYMDMDEYQRHLGLILSASRPGARMVYWNMLAKRNSTLALCGEIRSLDQLSSTLFMGDNAFFYSDLVVEELGKCSVISAQFS